MNVTSLSTGAWRSGTEHRCLEIRSEHRYLEFVETEHDREQQHTKPYLTVRTVAFKSLVQIKSCAEVGGPQVSLNTFSEYRKRHSNSGTFEASCDLTEVKRVRDSTQKTRPGLNL